MRPSDWIAMLVVTAACSGVPPDRVPNPTPRPDATKPVVAAEPEPMADAARAHPVAGLVARFETPAAAFASTSQGASLAFVVVNHGPQAAQIDLDQLGSAILGIDVFDSNGNRIPTIPPGTPPANYEPRIETLAPGASHRFVVDLNVFSPPLPPGAYEASVRGNEIDSGRIRFDIAK